MREEIKMGCVAYLHVILVAVVFLLITSGCATRVGQRTFEGATIGGVGGYVIGGPTGAKLGAVLGAGVGHAIGVSEEDAEKIKEAYASPTPLPWMYGERVSVEVRGGWGESLQATIEDELRGRGAVVVSSSRRHRRSDDIGAAYVVMVDTRQRGEYVIVSIRVIDARDNVVRAIGDARAWRGRYGNYGSGSSYEPFTIAARAAVEKLH
ncbi:hypothetical protein L6251_01675 [Candidatus Parcubacteria bacterium]|nr:hypothetical protein [Patescibacteria group bacterium]MBU4477189.1 hypothetical protein [Patescibacteria group bacterium]MCG2699110.1 hypothetical protein [Candidatus Parcubacteria bacterium]